MSSPTQLSSEILQDYFRTPPPSEALWLDDQPCASKGFFQCGPGLVCYGQSSCGVSPRIEASAEFDALRAAKRNGSSLCLPFDFTAIIENLRREHYTKPLYSENGGIAKNPLIRRAYYLVRELLPVGVRRHFQKAYFKDWHKLPFPHWPVDFTVDALHELFLSFCMKAQGVNRIPFIWFWPEGASACAILTHDVETAAGRDFSSALMDMDEARGFKASFQVIPEKRYEVPLSYWKEIRGRGFEFNVHDINHDGHLFEERTEFERRAELINGYAKKYQAQGFRAGAMYRNLDWYDAFEFSYDMSVPNVAHLEPQRGGCCTVMPYFVRRILEIPLTTSQDYSVFNILERFSIDLWKKQISLILGRNGLMSFLSHPDYLIPLKPRGVYGALLDHLREVCSRERVWHALPGELDRWWRARSQMRLVDDGKSVRILGPQSERARIAYANLDGDRIAYTIDPIPPAATMATSAA